MKKSSIIKNIIFGIGLVVLLATVRCVMWLTPSLWRDAEYITDEPIEVGNMFENHANYYQYNSDYALALGDKQLFFSQKPCGSYDTIYRNTLSVFDQGGAKRLIRTYGSFFPTNGYLYYSDKSTWEQNSSQHDLYSFDMVTGETTLLVEDQTWLNGEYGADGKFYMPKSHNATEYYAVDGKQINVTSYPQLGCIVNGLIFTVEQSESGGKHVVIRDGQGNQLPLTGDTPYGDLYLIPCEKGLLVFQLSNRNVLYLIDTETLVCTNIFSIPQCVDSDSAVNVYGDSAYVSFLRYVENGQKGCIRMENDPVEGTYRIDLEDFSVEKISDTIYGGLYIFDDTGIYACDLESNIYKLDFDGNVISTLLVAGKNELPFFLAFLDEMTLS